MGQNGSKTDLSEVAETSTVSSTEGSLRKKRKWQRKQQRYSLPAAASERGSTHSLARASVAETPTAAVLLSYTKEPSSRKPARRVASTVGGITRHSEDESVLRREISSSTGDVRGGARATRSPTPSDLLRQVDEELSARRAEKEQEEVSDVQEVGRGGDGEHEATKVPQEMATTTTASKREEETPLRMGCAAGEDHDAGTSTPPATMLEEKPGDDTPVVEPAYDGGEGDALVVEEEVRKSPEGNAGEVFAIVETKEMPSKEEGAEQEKDAGHAREDVESPAAAPAAAAASSSTRGAGREIGKSHDLEEEENVGQQIDSPSEAAKNLPANASSLSSSSFPDVDDVHGSDVIHVGTAKEESAAADANDDYQNDVDESIQQDTADDEVEDDGDHAAAGDEQTDGGDGEGRNETIAREASCDDLKEEEEEDALVREAKVVAEGDEKGLPEPFADAAREDDVASEEEGSLTPIPESPPGTPILDGSASMQPGTKSFREWEELLETSIDEPDEVMLDDDAVAIPYPDLPSWCPAVPANMLAPPSERRPSRWRPQPLGCSSDDLDGVDTTEEEDSKYDSLEDLSHGSTSSRRSSRGQLLFSPIEGPNSYGQREVVASPVRRILPAIPSSEADRRQQQLLAARLRELSHGVAPAIVPETSTSSSCPRDSLEDVRDGVPDGKDGGEDRRKPHDEDDQAKGPSPQFASEDVEPDSLAVVTSSRSPSSHEPERDSGFISLEDSSKKLSTCNSGRKGKEGEDESAPADFLWIGLESTKETKKGKPPSRGRTTTAARVPARPAPVASSPARKAPVNATRRGAAYASKSSRGGRGGGSSSSTSKQSHSVKPRTSTANRVPGQRGACVRYRRRRQLLYVEAPSFPRLMPITSHNGPLPSPFQVAFTQPWCRASTPRRGA